MNKQEAIRKYVEEFPDQNKSEHPDWKTNTDLAELVNTHFKRRDINRVDVGRFRQREKERRENPAQQDAINAMKELQEVAERMGYERFFELVEILRKTWMS